MRDWRVEALAELEDVRQRLADLKRLISLDIRRDDRVFRKIMASLTATSWTTPTAMGTPRSDVHPDYEACSHECYVPPDEVEHIERCGE